MFVAEKRSFRFKFYDARALPKTSQLEVGQPDATKESCGQLNPSQRSLHNASIFRRLLKVAVNGAHQCDFLNI